MAKTERRREKGRGGKEIKIEGAKEGEKKPKKERTMKVKKIAKEWEIWDKKVKVAKKLVPQRFYK